MSLSIFVSTSNSIPSSTLLYFVPSFYILFHPSDLFLFDSIFISSSILHPLHPISNSIPSIIPSILSFLIPYSTLSFLIPFLIPPSIHWAMSYVEINASGEPFRPVFNHDAVQAALAIQFPLHHELGGRGVRVSSDGCVP